MLRSKARLALSFLVTAIAFQAADECHCARAADVPGIVAEWRFDEGSGDSAKDSSGNGHDATLHNATWARRGDGSAIQFSGMEGGVDCGDVAMMNLSGEVTVEAWIKPKTTSWASPHLIGVTGVFDLKFSDRGQVWWFSGGGSHDVGIKIPLEKWSHIVATVDNKQRQLWVNGQFVARGKADGFKPKGRFFIGAKEQPFFNGSFDHVRVYNRVLSADEAITHFKQEAPEYGWNPDAFKRIQIKPYYYFDRGQVVVEADFRGQQPVAEKAQIVATITQQAGGSKPIASEKLAQLPTAGVANLTIACGTLVPGTYVIDLKLESDNQVVSSNQATFDFPLKVEVPQEPAPLPASPQKQSPFTVKVSPAGGLLVSINGVDYPFETKVSWPNGDFNRLVVGDAPPEGTEKGWNPQSATMSRQNEYEVRASGTSYTLTRRVVVHPTHIDVEDTYTNDTSEDLGLIIYNELALNPEQVLGTRFYGYEGGWRTEGSLTPHYGGASIFVRYKEAGIGMLPMDDVFVAQAFLDLNKQRAIMGTESLCLAPKGAYSLKWAIYPTGSGDYWDFLNTFRKNEDRIATVDGAPGFISYGPMNRRQVPSTEFVTNRGLKYAIIGCLSRSADNPGVSIEGFEFMDFPKEMQLMREQATALRAQYPGMKVTFHNAHTLYATNKPERFADSKLVGEDGTHKASGGAPYFSKAASDAGWNWYVYYPTPGNSFHDAMMKSIDVMMDDMGMDGVFVDGYLMGYGGRWTYDRWDGYSAHIDKKSKTIKRKVGCVVLLTQPSMIEYSRKVRDKGGIVIANGAIMTPSIAKEKYVLQDAECQSGPECHLAPSLLSLSLGPFANDKDIYLDTLDKLRWGVLYIPYNERINLTHPTLGSKQYPITFEEVRAGMVRGKERIVTMNSGVYEWPRDRQLHLVHKFDGRGAPAMNTFVTTSDSSGVRTQLVFDENESAVIERIPLTVDSAEPVNILMRRYEGRSINLFMNGRGDAKLNIFVGTSYPDKRDLRLKDGGVNPGTVEHGDTYRITLGTESITAKELDGTLVVPLKLNGQIEISVERIEAMGG